MTIGDLRKLIRQARGVYIRPFLGTCEAWVRISKPQALALFAAYPDLTPLVNLELDDHALFDNGDLYLG